VIAALSPGTQRRAQRRAHLLAAAVLLAYVYRRATVLMEVADQFWGDRFGTVQDPFGHTWSIATHVEDVTPEEIAERAKAAMADMSG
jgi:PhnB protein